MTHLDTNMLVAAAHLNSPSGLMLRSLLQSGEELATSSIAWTEFLSGPVTQHQIQDAVDLIEGRILPFGVFEAVRAANLFNRTGRLRGRRMDCMVAATAICAKAALATENQKDFSRFVSEGLRLL